MKNWLKALLSETAFSVWWILSALSTLCTFFIPALSGKWRLVSLVSAVVGFALANYRVFQKQESRMSRLSAAGASDAARTSHLAQIKQGVAEPVLRWLEEVVASLQGRPGATNSLLWIGTEPIAKQTPRVDEWPYDYAWTIKPAPMLWEPGVAEVLGTGVGTGGILSSAIFSDAERNHFAEQLSQLRDFLNQWRAFLSHTAAVARDCADSLQRKIGLPRPPLSGSLEEFASADYLVARCVRQILRRGLPYFRFEHPRDGVEAIHDPDDYSRVIAQGRREDELRGWAEEAQVYVEGQLGGSHFAEQAERLQADAGRTRTVIERIMLTHFLPGDCDLLVGALGGCGSGSKIS